MTFYAQAIEQLPTLQEAILEQENRQLKARVAELEWKMGVLPGEASIGPRAAEVVPAPRDDTKTLRAVAGIYSRVTRTYGLEVVGETSTVQMPPGDWRCQYFIERGDLNQAAGFQFLSGLHRRFIAQLAEALIGGRG